MTPSDGPSELTPDEMFDDNEAISACLKIMDERGMKYDQRLVVATTLLAYSYLTEMTDIVTIFEFCVEYSHVLRTAVELIDEIGVKDFRRQIDGSR